MREPLEQALRQRHGLDPDEAKSLASFIEPMLVYDPSQRATAGQLLAHRWLQQRDDEE